MQNDTQYSIASSNDLTVDISRVYIDPLRVSGLDQVMVDPGTEVVFSTSPLIAVTTACDGIRMNLESLRRQVDRHPIQTELSLLWRRLKRAASNAWTTLSQND